MTDNSGALKAYSDALQAAAEGRIDQFGAILLALATVGILAFAIIEVIKVFRVRELFNRINFKIYHDANPKLERDKRRGSQGGIGKNWQ